MGRWSGKQYTTLISCCNRYGGFGPPIGAVMSNIEWHKGKWDAVETGDVDDYPYVESDEEVPDKVEEFDCWNIEPLENSKHQDSLYIQLKEGQYLIKTIDEDRLKVVLATTPTLESAKVAYLMLASSNPYNSW
jgi:hypothetical protein